MSKAQTSGIERRTAKRYRVPGSARVFWDGEGAPVSLTDMSAGGCLLTGPHLPEVGTRVFLSLDIGGLPNVRLPAITVRREREGGELVAAVRFDVPAASIGGLDQLLAQHVHHQSEGLSVLVLDTDARSRERIADAVRAMGARVCAVGDPSSLSEEALTHAPNVVLARADQPGVTALSRLGRSRPGAFRVVFGRRGQIASALELGIAQAAADDPCSAKCLGELLGRGRPGAPS